METVPLTFNEIEVAEAKEKSIQGKRLTQYPIRVRKIKRLRRQIAGLNRCIRNQDSYCEVLYAELQKYRKFSEQKIVTVVSIGIICFLFGYIVG